jgi:DNA repair ATPase RecN
MTDAEGKAAIFEYLTKIQTSVDGMTGQLRDVEGHLRELDLRVSDVKESMRQEMETVREEILQFQLTRTKIEDVYVWSKKFRETVTISEVERLRSEVETLRQFRAKATMIFFTVQAMMGAALFWKQMFGG